MALVDMKAMLRHAYETVTRRITTDYRLRGAEQTVATCSPNSEETTNA